MMLKTNEVNKVYVGMSKEDAIKLETEKCEKCGHLVDDHFLPVNTTKSKKNKILHLNEILEIIFISLWTILN